MKTYSRRELLQRASALSVLSGAHLMLPGWMPRLAFSPRHRAPQGDVLVCVFLRGGADALNMIVPHGEDTYYQVRPVLAIPRPDASGSDPKALDLDGFFGIHPALSPLLPIFQSGQLTAIHATGSPDPTRSHFEAMSFMERGTPGSKTVSTGWIGRHLATLDTGNNSPVRAIGWGTSAQQSIRGTVSPVVLQSIADYHLGGRVDVAMQMMEAINGLYSEDTESLQIAAEATNAAIDVVSSVRVDQYQPQNGAVYDEDGFSFGLKQTAALIRAEVGLEAACLDIGGWDTHANQGGAEGNQAALMTTLAAGLGAFHTDMGADMSRVTLVVMSEFGRRVEENADAGTDHGHGGAMLVMSGNLAQGPVFARWPGLSPEYLDRGDLAITTDYRDVLAEIIATRLNNPLIDDIFPSFRRSELGLFSG
ncbi:MAG: DUF1501 domain-containing protein [Anaerolineales bacterium]|nr:DUF1501 domain-containing protein [Anaerolineales bacterium]